MIRTLSRLLRPLLALMNGVTAVAGYCLFPEPARLMPLLALLCGVTLLAMGGSAFNQLLERDSDALMTRTMLRPLPQGRLSVAIVTVVGVCAIMPGLALLAIPGALLPPLLGGSGLIWYLAVYTPLKRRTTLALLLGALCGAFPPLIGWCLAGGAPSDYRIILLAGLLFIWQIPHFWLLRERHEADYRRAGIPRVDCRATLSGRASLMLVWMTALTAATLLLPALGGIERRMTPWLLVIALIPFMVATLRSERLLFPVFTLFPLALTGLLVLQKMI